MMKRSPSPVRRRLGGAVLLALGGLCAWSAAWSNDAFPAKPIKLVIPYAAGGVTDVAGRMLADEMARTLGQPVVVENKVGAGGTIALDFVSKAAPDGYTLGIGNIGPLVVSPLFQQAKYDAVKDFTHLGTLCRYELVMVARPTLEANQLRELLQSAKAQPGKYTYASAGNGTIYHLAFEQINSLTGAGLVHVPYKGDAPAMADLMGGQVDIGMLALQGALPMIKAGKLKAFATTGGSRFKLTPELPTAGEAGLPGFEAYSWSTLVAPPGLPQPIVDKLNAALTAALRLPTIGDKFAAQGISPMPGTPAQAADFVRGENAKWGKVIRDARITVSN